MRPQHRAPVTGIPMLLMNSLKCPQRLVEQAYYLEGNTVVEINWLNLRTVVVWRRLHNNGVARKVGHVRLKMRLGCFRPVQF